MNEVRVKKIFILLTLSFTFISCEMSEVKQIGLADDLVVGTSFCNTTLTAAYAEEISNDKYEVLEGQILNRIEDFADGSYKENLVLNDGDKNLLVLSKDDPKALNIPRNKKVQLLVDKSTGQLVSLDNQPRLAVLDSINCSNSKNKSKRSSSDYVHYLDPSGETKVILLFEEFNGDIEEDSPDILKPIVNNAKMDLIREYFKKSSFGRLALDIQTYAIPDYGLGFESNAKRFKSLHSLEADITGYISKNKGGGGVSEGPTFYCDTDGTFLITHELSHSLGLHHAGDIDVDGKYTERGDASNVLGALISRTLEQPWVGIQRYMLDLHNPQTFKSLNTTSKVFFVDGDKYQSTVPQDRSQLVEVTKNKKYIYISYRESQNKIYIHKLDQSSRKADKVRPHKYTGYFPKSLTTLMGSLSSGESGIYENIRVEFKNNNDSVAEVDIYTSLNDKPPGITHDGSSMNGKCDGLEVPANGELCLGDDIDIFFDEPYMTVKSCTDQRKCEVLCDPGFKPSADGTECIAANYTCLYSNYIQSKIAEYGLILCEGDDIELTGFLDAAFRPSCSGERKCEYTCPAGTTYQGGFLNIPASCRADRNYTAAEVDIMITNHTNNVSDSFKLGEGAIKMEVTNAGANAKGCIEFQLVTGQSYTECSKNTTSSDVWKEMSKSDEWEYTNSTWSLTTDLTQPNYYQAGTYTIYWYNPDTGKKKIKTYTVSE